MLHYDLLKAMSEITEYRADEAEHAVNLTINSHPSYTEMIYFPQIVKQLCSGANERDHQNSNASAQLTSLKNIYLSYIKQTCNPQNFDSILKTASELEQEYSDRWAKFITVNPKDIALDDIHAYHIAHHESLSKAAASQIDSGKLDIPLEMILTQLQGNSCERVSIPSPCGLNFIEFVSQLNTGSQLLIQVSEWMKHIQLPDKVVENKKKVNLDQALRIIGTVILCNYNQSSTINLLHNLIDNELYKRFVLSTTQDTQLEIIHWFILHLGYSNTNIIDKIKATMETLLAERIKSNPAIKKQFRIFDSLKATVENEIRRDGSDEYQNITSITQLRADLLSTAASAGSINHFIASVDEVRLFCMEQLSDQNVLIESLSQLSKLANGLVRDITSSDIRSFREIWGQYSGSLFESLNAIKIKDTTSLVVVNIARVDPHARLKPHLSRMKKRLSDRFKIMKDDFENILGTFSKMQNIYNRAKASHQTYCTAVSVFSHHNEVKTDQLSQHQVNALIRSEGDLRKQVNNLSRMLQDKNNIISKYHQKLKHAGDIIVKQQATIDGMEAKKTKPARESEKIPLGTINTVASTQLNI